MINATPPVTGKDAERILYEMRHGTPNTPQRLATIRRADELFQRVFGEPTQKEGT